MVKGTSVVGPLRLVQWLRTPASSYGCSKPAITVKVEVATGHSWRDWHQTNSPLEVGDAGNG